MAATCAGSAVSDNVVNSGGVRRATSHLCQSGQVACGPHIGLHLRINRAPLFFSFFTECCNVLWLGGATTSMCGSGPAMCAMRMMMLLESDGMRDLLTEGGVPDILFDKSDVRRLCTGWSLSAERWSDPQRP